MNIGKKITELREATEISRESSYLVSMGDGTGTKQVKHKTLVEQLLTDMELPYDQTLAALRAGDEEGKTMIPNLQAISDWIMSKIVNNLLTTEAGYFMDGRQGPVIQRQLDALTSAISQLNSDMLKNSERYLALLGLSNSGITSYPDKTGLYRVTLNAPQVGVPSNYGALLITGCGFYIHLYVSSEDRMWIGHTSDLIKIPTRWKEVATL